MRILVLDGSLPDAMIALVSRQGAELLVGGRERVSSGLGSAERLAASLSGLLDEAGWPVASLDLIAAVTGPGSFTGLRASLALAQGLAAGTNAGLQGVRKGDALRRGVAPQPGLELWCVGMARRDRVFLERCDQAGVVGALAEAYALEALPLPSGPVVVAGDARRAVAMRLRAAGADVQCSDVERPDAVCIAAVACDQHAGRQPARAALPDYVDPPEARLPAAGLRPLPV